jgi:hypothetical protein
MMSEEVNTPFTLLYNILLLRVKIDRWTLLAQNPRSTLPRRGRRPLCTSVVPVSGWSTCGNRWRPHTGPIQDEDFPILVWPRRGRDYVITVTVLVFVFFAWAARDGRRPPTFASLTELVRLKPAPFLLLW